MAKIWKSSRKLHKTAQEKYKDSMKKFRSSLSKTQVQTDIEDIKEVERQWIALGGRKAFLYQIGINKAKEILRQRIAITSFSRPTEPRLKHKRT